MAETKRKGQIAELAVMAEAVARGYRVSIPFCEDSPYDMIVDRNGRLERVQCKYVESDGRVIIVRCRCTNNWVQTRYTPATIDWIATYDHVTKRCFFVPSSMLGDEGRTQIHLRLQGPANNQRIGILWAADFTEW